MEQIGPAPCKIRCFRNGPCEIRLIKVIFYLLILLISPEEQKIQKFNMLGEKTNLKK